ncbi:MAG: hypothetical protein J1E35_10205 [Lachnospiraceae bacterium]|nr:hypothetical protein [Lachnospiraceae bacterium]
MDKGTTYTYQGFTFKSEAELKEAKKEAEVVAYIRSKADLSNVKTIVTLYNRLIEKKTLGTVLGISFLQELRSRALDSGVVAESSLHPLPEPVKIAKEPEKKGSSKERKMMELYRDRSKKLTFTVAVLCIVIVILIVIRLFGTASPFTDYERKVLDEYGGWKDKLSEKEEQLHSWEQELLDKEKALSEWERSLREREEALQ